MFEALLFYLLISVVFNLALFIVAFKLQSDKLTDISYALSFLILAGAAFALNEKTAYGTVLLIMVAIWAIRIGGFLLYRVIRAGKDARFDDMRSSFLKFGQFWLLQGVSVWVLMIPFILALTTGTVTFGGWALAGFVAFAAGLVIETVADLQKLAFNSRPQNKGKWIESGIWRYSRHPNYFGEILVWVGVYIYTIQALGGTFGVLVGLINPVFISLLLIFVSGIPLLEKSADKRWGRDKAYRAYKARTSVLVLWPRRRSS